MEPNTGETERKPIEQHMGYMRNGNILDAIPEGDFTQQRYVIAQIKVKRGRRSSMYRNICVCVVCFMTSLFLVCVSVLCVYLMH